MALISGGLFTKMLQLLGDGVPQNPCRGFAPETHCRGISVPQTSYLPPSQFNLLDPLLSSSYFICREI